MAQDAPPGGTVETTRQPPPTPPESTTRPAARHWTVTHSVWTLLWFAALAGILFGFMSKNETVAFASMIASLVPPVALVFLEWQEKQRRRNRGNKRP